MNFTRSQQSAIDAFTLFLKGDSQVFMLKGAAGTGKTTIVSEFVSILKAQNRKFRLMAPTGRAAFILGRKIGAGIGASTIHKAIYLLAKLSSTGQNKDSEDDGGVHAHYALKTNEDHASAVYIVDESSMISDVFSENESFSFGSGMLLSDLFLFAKGRKIVFVGDYAQLPPVGMNFSPALDKTYIEQHFDCKAEEVYLREVVRQKDGSVMLSNANKVRDCIEAHSFVEFGLSDGVDTHAEDEDLLRPYFKLSQSTPDPHSAIIAYSNKQALEYNLAIRRHYFGNDVQRLIPGDLLIIARNNYSFDYELFNGNIVQVESCSSDQDVKSRMVRVKLGKDRVESVELRFRDVVIKFNTRDGAKQILVTILDNFLDDPNGALGGLLASALVVDFNNRLPSNLKQNLSQIKKWMHQKTGLTVAQQELCDSYIRLLSHDPYYNALICKYGYAMTCHKAQGGEWKNVFVDMCRYGGTANEDYFRWAYTAITRASDQLWHFRSPDFNYISQMVVDDIKLSNKIKVSCYAPDDDFIRARMNRLDKLCHSEGITLSDDLSKQYQHIITFTDEPNQQSAQFQLWYNAGGYTGKDMMLKASSDDFTAICRSLLNASFAPDSIPFNAPDRPFAHKLVEYMKSLFRELDIKLLNISQEQYQDVFHLQTDGLAKVCLYYTGKVNYTRMSLISSIGQEDAKLEALRQRFKNNSDYDYPRN